MVSPLFSFMYTRPGGRKTMVPVSANSLKWVHSCPEQVVLCSNSTGLLVHILDEL
jgi:hypothetical protein